MKITWTGGVIGSIIEQRRENKLIQETVDRANSAVINESFLIDIKEHAAFIQNDELMNILLKFGNRMATEGHNQSNMPIFLNQIMDECMQILSTIEKESSIYKDCVKIIVKNIPLCAVQAIDKIQDSDMIMYILYRDGKFDAYKRLFDKIDMIVDTDIEDIYSPNKSIFDSYYNSVKILYAEDSAEDSGGCYIATMVYGDYDHPQVMILRQFRDNVLDKSSFGKWFIKMYYHYSPELVEKLKDKTTTNNVIRKALNIFIKIIK
jgi:hypothetical protein